MASNKVVMFYLSQWGQNILRIFVNYSLVNKFNGNHLENIIIEKMFIQFKKDKRLNVTNKLAKV